MNILNKIEHQHQQNLPFVVYRKPNESSVSGFFQKTGDLFFTENFTEKGFVFAPFNDKNQAVLIPENKSEFLQEELIINEEFEHNNKFSSDDSSKESHIKIVKKAIQKIEENDFKKVVISRKEEVELNNFNLVTTFKKLLQTYTNACVYIWFHPKVGLWLGATPETLLKVNDDKFETMALAGTQLYKGTTDVVWQQKEIDEQQFVTDYIVDNLKPIVKTISASKVQTIKAGNLLHLRTKLSGKLKTKNLKLITKLHPTPAVCGLPLESSKEFILKNENYNRSFYTGFLGEINTDSILYVNLRCMEIVNSKAIIYVGGGITKESNPEKEWEETVAKTRVMKKVL